MTTSAKRQRKKYNHRFSEKAIAAREARAEAHRQRIAASATRKSLEDIEADNFLGAPLPKHPAT